MGKSDNGRIISAFFGENVFDLETMRQVLPAPVFQNIVESIAHGGKLDMDTANRVALAMKDWAVSKNCTHYTHWFQPMTGFTAEKHDAFIDHFTQGRVLESFTGRQLIQGEPDASSFPSGGLRTTFEARGYSIWDPSSPAFVLEYPHGNTLCIPSIFISYTGESLDKKGPLLRAQSALNAAALGILSLFENPARQVHSTLGVEQEYFLIDRDLYLERPDLVQTGRTLFGRPPAKHQQLEDQYFGNIPERAFAFMSEFEEEAYRLGIPLKTRHNEVAPNQFEVAPIFEDVNVAVDHNQILMDLMDRIAKRHGLAVLFHEKPFAYVNGSGKHCNWALATDRGENLLKPGKTPQSNLQFLVFLISAVKAVHDHARLLRAAIASAANDHRLGANEAPPAIISVFLGDMLTRVLSDLEAGRTTETTDQAWLNVGIDKIPEVKRDNTDRNRTSPFAFTGNKFEFRAVGSSATPATAITVMNAAMAATLDEARTRIEEGQSQGLDFAASVTSALRAMLAASKTVLFEGDNYSEEWRQEAARRGLPNVIGTAEAVQAITSEESRALFSRYRIFNERELEAWHHIDLENFIKQIDIEAKVTLECVSTLYVPAVISYLNEVTTAVSGIREVLSPDQDPSGLTALVLDLATRIGQLRIQAQTLRADLEAAHALPDLQAQGQAFTRIKVSCEALRTHVDELEFLVSDAEWPVPKYREMLFSL